MAESKHSGGRPRKDIDKVQFEKLCALQCTLSEICSFFEVTEKTLQGWVRRTYNDSFSHIREEKAEQGKISLRRYQFELAKRYPAMAIFLGKQILRQSEEPARDAAETEPINITLTVQDVSKGAPDA